MSNIEKIILIGLIFIIIIGLSCLFSVWSNTSNLVEQKDMLQQQSIFLQERLDELFSNAEELKKLAEENYNSIKSLTEEIKTTNEKNLKLIEELNNIFSNL